MNMFVSKTFFSLRPGIHLIKYRYSNPNVYGSALGNILNRWNKINRFAP